MARDLRNLLIRHVGTPAIEEAARHASGRMLDIGCGTKPFEGMFAPYVDEHVGVDHPETLHDLSRADLVSGAYDLPVQDGSFDTVLCTAVLEHLEEPAAALREARRALKDGGVAIYTIPFFWHLHEEPRDFYRFTPHGIRHLFEQAGFEVDEVRPLGGFWVTAGQMFSYYLYDLPRGPFRRLPIIPALSLAVQAIAYLLERVHRAEKWSWMYLVVARARPAGS